MQTVNKNIEKGHSNILNMGLLNTCIALLALKISMTSAASNLLEKIKADPDLSQVHLVKQNISRKYYFDTEKR